MTTTTKDSQTTYTPTKSDPVVIRVTWDAQDQANVGWSYQLYDGSPAHSADWVLTESGQIDGRQSATVRPSRARVLRSAGVAGGRHAHVIFD